MANGHGLSQVRARLLRQAAPLLARVEEVGEEGGVMVTLWETRPDPVVEEVLALARVC